MNNATSLYVPGNGPEVLEHPQCFLKYDDVCDYYTLNIVKNLGTD